MEKRDLYDINKNLTGETVFKGEKTPAGKYILVVLVFIQNSKGEFLIQKRSLKKDGKFASTGGHPKSGESSIQGMLTEIKEEIGLDVDEKELELVFVGKTDINRAFYDIYYLKKDIDIKDLILEKQEVDFVEWYSVEHIKKLIEDGLFLENHADEFFRVLDYLESKNS